MRKPRATVGIPLQVPFEKSLLHHFPAVALEFDVERNLPTDLGTLAKYSRYNFWWLCQKNHSYRATVYNRTYGKRGCPYCAGKRVLKGFNDVATTNPELNELWSITNELKLSDVSAGSGISLQWCGLACGHSFQAAVRFMVKAGKDFCPFCKNHRLLPGFNDLATKDPTLATRWHSQKNKPSTPSLVLYRSSKKYWWVCPRGHESYEAIGRRNEKWVCRFCVVGVSELEKSVGSFIEESYSGALVRNSRKVIAPYELDFYLPKLSIAIEVNGDYFHSNEVIENTKGLSAREYHLRKYALCKKRGVELLFLWEGTWKGKRKAVETALLKVFRQEDYDFPDFSRLEL